MKEFTLDGTWSDHDSTFCDFYNGAYMPTESQRPQRKAERKRKEKPVIRSTVQPAASKQKPGKKENANFKAKVKTTTEKALEIVDKLGLNLNRRGTLAERSEWRKAWGTLIVTIQMLQISATMNATHEAIAEIEGAPSRELFRQMWNDARNLCPYSIERLRAIIKQIK